ncbi:membrane-spanning 4-domains subfamily A member 4A-like [Phyllobates terribilis]|uniref:membrane-spanning 4-domains subfamily A member 4A-like n=1 Tax=Phyllobates terribilis TaxID=111132 RepID=UPI003CCB36F8
MMSKPQMSPMTPVNGFMVPPTNSPPSNSIPYQFQSNIILGPHGNNAYSSIPPWNVTQVGPQNFPPMTTNQLNAQHVIIPQSNPNYIIPQLTNTTSWLQTFEKGKPKSLGILLIISAICQILLAIGLPFMSYSISFYSGIHFWASVFYIIAGALTISAQKRQSIPQVKASFGLNIVSSIFSFTGIIINAVDFFVVYCNPYYGCTYYYPAPAGAYIILAILFLLNLLVFCVTVSIAVFGGRALDQVPINVPPVFVIQNMVPVNPSAYPPNSSEFSVPPPPYGHK